jgi:hypothetical protein
MTICNKILFTVCIVSVFIDTPTWWYPRLPTWLWVFTVVCCVIAVYNALNELWRNK